MKSTKVVLIIALTAILVKKALSGTAIQCKSKCTFPILNIIVVDKMSLIMSYLQYTAQREQQASKAIVEDLENAM